MPASTFDIRNSIRIAGAFIAWVIGSGFATGQEMLRFYASFGLYGYGAVAVNLVGFLGMAYLLMRTGFEHKKEPGFNHFPFFCGQRLGLVYTWLIIATLILLMPVLVAGAGATLYEYYRVPQPLGSAVMTTAILLNGNAAAGLDIPVLYLAQKLHPLLGAAFSITLLLGIFSSSSVMMWSICSRVTCWGKQGNVAFAVAVALFTYVVSLFSFGRLVAVLYPAIGYAGLLFIACVVYKNFKT